MKEYALSEAYVSYTGYVYLRGITNLRVDDSPVTGFVVGEFYSAYFKKGMLHRLNGYALVINNTHNGYYFINEVKVSLIEFLNHPDVSIKRKEKVALNIGKYLE